METTLAQYIPESPLKRFVCFGPESTGKTTLTQDLAAYFGVPSVGEYMREYLQQKWNETRQTCMWDDLVPIAVGQMQWENEQAQKSGNLLFCDTNLLELMTYSEIYYEGNCPSAIKKYALENHYDFYFLTNIDVPWEADDLRDRPNDRQYMFDRFKETLDKYQKPYITLMGDAQQRLEAAVGTVRKIIQHHE
ncbi:MAG: ATP-binding protein [Capnocytophaga sp.]|nr:ATP-binding protein [Capnocytophaga sp.]